MKTEIQFAIIAMFSVLSISLAAAPQGGQDVAAADTVSLRVTDRCEVKVDWQKFLKRHDMIWNRIPSQWYEAPFLGNLLWACHNYWLHCRYSMDERRTEKKFYPLLQRCVNYYLHFLTKDKIGRLHIPKTMSPEYTFERDPDTNYDLALLKWGLQTIIELSGRYKIKEPRLGEYKQTLKALTDYPQDENGMMIAAGVPFANGHRHFSHLLMFYPLYLLNSDTAGAKELAMKSVKHWHSLGHRKGYSWTGGSLIASSFGLGNESLEYLNGLKSFIQPNTLYKESGPVIETPLSAAQSIQNMLLQSWGGVIRVFPAIPDKWQNVTISNLRTEGAFLVSAIRNNGKTGFICIKSLAGEPCLLKCDIANPECTVAGKFIKLHVKAGGTIQLNLKKGEIAILYPAGGIKDSFINQWLVTMKQQSAFGMR